MLSMTKETTNFDPVILQRSEYSHLDSFRLPLPRPPIIAPRLPRGLPADHRGQGGGRRGASSGFEPMPFGSVKKTAAAGIQQWTIGSLLGSPLKPRGSTPAARNFSGAANSSSIDTDNAR